MPARHNQFRSNNHIRNLSEIWDQAVLNLRPPPDTIAETVVAFVPDLAGATKEINQLGLELLLPTSAITIEFVSDNAGDNQFILFEFINDTFDYITTLIQLNGLTPVVVPNVFRALLARNASGFTVDDVELPNNGPIVGIVHAYKQGATPGLDGNTFLVITPTIDIGGGINALIVGQRSYGSQSSIPKGFSAYVKSLQPWVGKNDDVKVAIQAKPRNGEWATEIPIGGINQVDTANAMWRYVPEGFDIRIVGQEAQGTGTVPVMIEYQLLLIKHGI